LEATIVMRPARASYLVEKATHAAVAAIEIYNKPGFKYREEAFSILMLNAWELLLKARIVKENKNKLRAIEIWEPRKTKFGEPSKKLFPKRNRAGNTMTIGVLVAAEIVRKYPKDNIDQYAIENIALLVEIRDNAIHFHNVGRGLRKRVQEIGAAALRNFAYAAKSWFACDLGSYNFALMPFAFETPAGVIQTVFADDTKGAAARVAKLLADQEQRYPFETTKPYNVGVEVELRFVRKAIGGAVSVKIAQTDPNAVPVTITEEDVLKTYQWRYQDLTAGLRKRFKSFKENDAFHRVRKSLENDPRFCCVRQLDPRNKKSARQKFYNPNIISEFEKHYSNPT
jgi:Protein of unknown function (DUF3644)/EC042_2821-lke REase